MLISVIITTYNSPNFLRKCIDSFFFQLDKDFELIVADDGSTKETKELINEYKDSKINILHAWQKDKGFRAAKIRNEAVKISSGKYLIFIDGDDWRWIIGGEGNHRAIVASSLGHSELDGLVEGIIRKEDSKH